MRLFVCLFLLSSCLALSKATDEESSLSRQGHSFSSGEEDEEDDDPAELIYLQEQINVLEKAIGEFDLRKGNLAGWHSLFIGRQVQTPVIFDAYVDLGPEISSYVYSGEIIHFDNTNVNVGDGFNTLTGTFTAPVKGAYLFFFTSEAFSDTVHCHLDMLVNGERVSGFHDDGAVNEIRQVKFFSFQLLDVGDIVMWVASEESYLLPGRGRVLGFGRNQLRVHGELIEELDREGQTNPAGDDASSISFNFMTLVLSTLCAKNFLWIINSSHTLIF